MRLVGVVLISHAFCNPDVPSFVSSHNVNCCYTDAPLFGRLCLETLRHVRIYYFLTLAVHHGQCCSSGHDNPPPRDLAFSETNQTSAMSIPIQVTLNIQQHPTLQMGFHSLRIGTDVEVQEKPDGLHLRDNVEGNV